MTMQKIYLASRYSRQEELRGYREILESRGLEVTSRWLESERPPEGTDWSEFFAKWCQIDLHDICIADTIIVFGGYVGMRGMMHGELGFALALRLTCYVLEARPNAMYYHPDIIFFDSFDAFIEAMTSGRPL